MRIIGGVHASASEEESAGIAEKLSHELAPGDYQRMDAGSVHERQWTEGGCLLLIASSKRDELLD